MLKINSISLIKSNLEISTVEFKKGFNLVYGPSNTGKSVIVDCIDFVFGSNKPINPNFNPKEVKMNIECELGTATLIRVCGKKSIIVESTNIEGIECKEYFNNSKNGMTSSDVLLKMMGLKDSVDIIKNSTWDTQNLTLRTFSNSFIIKENEISKEGSIILPDQVVSVTAFKSAILYLLTLDNHIDPQGNPFEKAQKRKVLINYLENEISKIKVKLDNYSNFKLGETIEVEKHISDLLKQISELEQQLNEKINENKTISEELIAVNDEIVCKSNFLEKYEQLLSQYESDLRRLEMIVDGKSHESGTHDSIRCPFCNGELNMEQEETCEEAAGSELLRLIPQIKDLKEAKSFLNKELKELISKREALIDSKKKVEKIISQELKPLINKLNNQITAYKNAIVVENNFKNDSERLNDLTEQLNEARRIPEKPINYSPDTYLNDALNGTFENEIGKMLIETGYLFHEFSFDLKTMDLNVNGHLKANEGEGFRGFFNTIIALALQKILSNKAHFFPGVLVIDSPIMSLKEQNIDNIQRDKYKKGLFKCLQQAASKLQIIIIENEKPDIDYENSNVIEFTKNPNKGRYGFVKNYID